MSSKPTTIYCFHHKKVGRVNQCLFLKNPSQSNVFTPNTKAQSQSVYMSSKPTTNFCFHHKNKGRVNQCLFSLEAISPQILKHKFNVFKAHRKLQFSTQILKHKSKQCLPSYIVFNRNIKTYVQTASLSSKPTAIYCFLHT